MATVTEDDIDGYTGLQKISQLKLFTVTETDIKKLRPINVTLACYYSSIQGKLTRRK